MKGNAKIIGTTLGYEVNGILTCYIRLLQDSTSQSFGGFNLSGDYDTKTKKHTPSLLCGFFISRVLDVVGVDMWESLIGKYLRVDGEEFGRIAGIGNIIEDRWFYPKKELLNFLK